MTMRCVFTIDVEDWFHILDLSSTPNISEWDALPSHLERNFLRLLDILSETNTRATCFFLGWVAERFPDLVREAVQRGHEVASHGYSHRLVYGMTPGEFLEDVTHAKKVIEDASGQQVLGYRAPGFSVTEETPWFFDRLMEAGYRYDSSVFPGPRGHGGLRNGRCAPYRLGPADEFVEFPVSVERIAGRPVCFFGGGYLRLFPYSLVKSMTRRVLSQDRPVIFYVHPREIDPGQPRLAMSLARRVKSYINLSSTEGKIRKLCTDFEMAPFQDILAMEMQRHSAKVGNREVMQIAAAGQVKESGAARV
jgi:polysaccharide deacetylase family protein (PEP-CTERM system associated)